ncbi:Transposon Ty3-G Gag-Pol poly [Paramuricea clavata]|uniref:Transposon Ty3-G Gag-Pol poly n=1 Tax=Paramuricea clavata TaxID=317549 RepID=A0A7D9JDC0_PARCT|nr:Transposon Ty3-G Gag-Pol poly [Paramuricea clavata]
MLDGVTYRGMRIVVPPSMQQEMIELVHETHQGIVKSKQRAREALYWPGMSSQFEAKSKNYVLSVEYYSKYIEVTELNDLSAFSTIEALRGHFERHGIPERLTTDCGTQYTSVDFKNFAKAYNFQHVLISPKHPKANGEAEVAVEIVKSLWRKNNDKHKTLLVYRTTPLAGIDLSPSQLCTAWGED